ncbi:hypothetical protein BIW11_05827 [Tropilaelaps mercedesae]|uniref:Uncharacterized protein n=1 Tax=Tropilaelaps mercedesae TaxID=418985 RepID=A0A1V9Y0T7_9ACAR|nr:hypothetical protein BIW11_05827 [Tropilaelaps mercedesae]
MESPTRPTRALDRTRSVKTPTGKPTPMGKREQSGVRAPGCECHLNPSFSRVGRLASQGLVTGSGQSRKRDVQRPSCLHLITRNCALSIVPLELCMLFKEPAAAMAATETFKAATTQPRTIWLTPNGESVAGSKGAAGRLRKQ